MNPIAILFTLLLAAASTFASLPLPDGYRVTKVIPVPKEYQLDQVKGNPNVPLMNASIERGKMHMPFWVHIYIRGTNWPGLEEKTVRDLSRHAVVDKWKFETDGDGFYLDVSSVPSATSGNLQVPAALDDCAHLLATESHP